MTGPSSIDRKFRLELSQHSDGWAAQAQGEALRLSDKLQGGAIRIYHIGSTSVSGLLAKPTIDLMVEVDALTLFDRVRQVLEAAGYEWWGDFGMQGRRLLVRIDPRSGNPILNAHGFATGSPHLTRHLAFREYLRAHADRARAYEAEKLRCQLLAGDDRATFGKEKQAWVTAEEAVAIRWFQSQSPQEIKSVSLERGVTFHP